MPATRPRFPHASGLVQAPTLGGRALFSRVILRVVVGSRAYGLAEPESDTDRRGVFLPPAELHWSLYGVPEQIDDAVAEMIEMQARQGSPDPVVHERFHALGRAHLARSVADPALAGRYFDTFGYDAPHVRLARAQFFGQPDYLD